MDRIPRIDIGGAKIDRFPPPVVERLPAPAVESLPYPTLRVPRPVVEIPSVRIDYPTLPALPVQAPNVSAPSRPGEQSGKPQERPERSLPASPPTPPVLPPQVEAPRVPVPAPEIPSTPQTEASTIEIAGHEIVVPTVKEVAQASVTAVVGTTATLVTAMMFNQVRQVLGKAVTQAARDKFKIKLRVIKPVIHLIQETDGVTVMEYSVEGVKTLATNVTNPEQYLRDTIEADELYEADHKIVIDEPIRERFSKEGAKRFDYFAPSKKMARRLSARLTLG